MTTGTQVEIRRLAAEGEWRAQLLRDARAGLTAASKNLPPMYFYDARGSQLFEEITRLPEYYQTRAEGEILEQVADDVIADIRPVSLVELGSGASRKTRLLLDALGRTVHGGHYVSLDVSEEAVREAAASLADDYPDLAITGLVGDFHRHLGHLRPPRPALVAFLGSTIGNLEPPRQHAFLQRLASTLQPGDGVLIGFDLVKGPAVLQAAYDDAAGVTAAFNRNVLHVLNHELGADFAPESFTHVARYDAQRRWVEMVLRAQHPMRVRIPDLDLEISFAEGEELRTEISCKFTRADVERLYASSGLALRRWMTDPDDRFAVALGSVVGPMAVPS